ncbi:MAG: hypothetical protein ABUL72_02100, partial [Armatimonadota bacterium]
MADKFDWKKVLKTPFGKQEDRSAEVLFLPTEEVGRPTASFDTLSNRPVQPAAPIQPESPTEYQPKAPLVLPPAAGAVGDWGEDAYTPAELASLKGGTQPISIPPVMESEAPVPVHVPEQMAAAPTIAPEALTPIQVSGWADPVAAPQPMQPAPVEAAATLETVSPHVENTFGPLPTQEPTVNRADDILARFGVQRAAPRHAPNAQPASEGSPNDILGDLERLLAGIAPEPKADEAAHVSPIQIESVAHPEQPVYEPMAHHV